MVKKLKLKDMSIKQLLNRCANLKNESRLICEEIDKREFHNPKLMKSLKKISIKV